MTVFSCGPAKVKKSVTWQPHRDKLSGIKIVTWGPRGGDYTDPSGNKLGYRIFSNRITNGTNMPIDLTINFSNDKVMLSPADSITSPDISKPDRYAKVFLFPYSMLAHTQQEAINYGITGLESFLDTGLNKPTVQKITIEPNQDYYLYIGALIYPSSEQARSELFIDGQHLIYKIMIGPPWYSSLIPCGQIDFKESQEIKTR